MINDVSPKKLAYKILRDNNISRPTLDNLVFLINSYGFDIIDFDINESNESIGALVDRLNLRQMITSSKAFTYKSGDVKLIFISDSLTAEEKSCALAHELGHIVLNHLKNGCVSPDISEEYQSNEFVHYLLHPNPAIVCVQSIKRHKRNSVIIAVSIALIIASIVTVQQINQLNSYYGEYYITQNGEKYHEHNCIFVKDKNNVHRMTEEEYESGKYEPCQICLPE